MSYKKTLTETATQTPEQQRAAEVGNKHAGGKPKGPKPEQMGVQPDEARSQREQQIRGRSDDR